MEIIESGKYHFLVRTDGRIYLRLQRITKSGSVGVTIYHMDGVNAFLLQPKSEEMQEANNVYLKHLESMLEQTS